MEDTYQRIYNIYVIVITGLALGFLSVLMEVRDIIAEKNFVISGQEATIAAYKDNLTSCLKDSKVAAQDEFTGE